MPFPRENRISVLLHVSSHIRVKLIKNFVRIACLLFRFLILLLIHKYIYFFIHNLTINAFHSESYRLPQSWRVSSIGVYVFINFIISSVSLYTLVICVYLIKLKFSVTIYVHSRYSSWVNIRLISTGYRGQNIDKSSPRV